MIHNPCQCCGLQKMYVLDPYCERCLKMIGTEDPADSIGRKAQEGYSDMVKKVQDALRPNLPPPEPTALTRDQAIRAKALEMAIAFAHAHAVNKTPEHTVSIWGASKDFEDYIRDGRKGGE